MKECGLTCGQLSMGCAGLPAMPDEIPPELVARIRREVDARGITIASLEGTFNMSHPDPNHRRIGLRRLHVLAAVCEPPSDLLLQAAITPRLKFEVQSTSPCQESELRQP